MAIRYCCEDCGAEIEGDDLESFGDAFITHARTAHPEWPYPDVAIRNYAEATQRHTGSRERLERIGTVTVHPVDADRVDHWLELFDHRAFVDNPAWAACYCIEPHMLRPDAAPAETDARSWQHNRALMIERLSSASTFGYLAYVDDGPAGWINASRRDQYTLYCQGTGAAPADADVLGVSCFVIAPPYRRHGLAGALLDRTLADAPARALRWVEAYPFKEPQAGDPDHFRGPMSLYRKRGFREVEQRGRYVVVRRQV